MTPTERRGFLADLLDALKGANVKAVAFDILFDQATEDEKDIRLALAIRDFPAPVVVAWGDDRAGLTEDQQDSLYDLWMVRERRKLGSDSDDLDRLEKEATDNLEADGLDAARIMQELVRSTICISLAMSCLAICGRRCQKSRWPMK